MYRIGNEMKDENAVTLQELSDDMDVIDGIKEYYQQKAEAYEKLWYDLSKVYRKKLSEVKPE